jgi:mannose-6-phosphate isomerase-like protein (cupin superfamily)
MTMDNEGVVRLTGEGKLISVLGAQILFKATGAETHGQYTSFELTAPPGYQGPPMHLHRQTDEAFYVVSGQMTVHVGARSVPAMPGSYVLAQRGALHSFANPGAEPARMLCICAPSGIEEYFEEILRLLPPGGGMPDRAAVLDVMGRYDTFLPPADRS